MNAVVAHTSMLGEGPVWDARTQTICWVDILSGVLHQFNTRTQQHTSLPVHQLLGAVAVCTNGDFVAALQQGLGFINRDTGAIKMIDAPECHLPNNRFNDGKCDPAGRFWAGTVSLSEQPGAGSIYMLDNNLQIVKKIKHLTIPNGMAWSADARTFYYIDTPAYAVTACDYDDATGDISARRVVIRIPEKDGAPDGMTIDSEGMLWIAHWDGWQVTRWNPQTGEQLHRVALPVARVTSCTFGGENLGDLYITTARKGLSESDLAAQPLAGSLFVVPDCGFTGVAAALFHEQRVAEAV
ncbi:SMP-30/gluconolactonase/LRE family protein [Deminuibacter soli]|uniref:Regucalcin n=2 Tax=Deminuibacter soli TaxID=2291815 RepID=A0A3E1NFP5_9BACT|nr:SMP-30/gluconolactonase/LRE family protein [Deminuibacter soli]